MLLFACRSKLVVKDPDNSTSKEVPCLGKIGSGLQLAGDPEWLHRYSVNRAAIFKPVTVQADVRRQLPN